MVTATRTLRLPPVVPDHPVGWFAPQPLWARLARDTLVSTRGRPALLRFATDTFMEDLVALLAGKQPDRLAEYVAAHETWQLPSAGLDAEGHDKPGDLKLFQPSHARFYLVAGALACKVPGVPDREIDTAQSESVFFVLRRQTHSATLGDIEYGWSTGQESTVTPPPASNPLPLPPTGYQDAAPKGWVPLGNPAGTVLASEERLPLFPLPYQQDGVTRTVLAGMVPVSSKDTFQAAGTPLSPMPLNSSSAAADPRPILFQQQIIEPFHGLRSWFRTLVDEGRFSSADRAEANRTTVHSLLDLMTQLRDHLRPLYDKIVAGDDLSPAPSGRTHDMAVRLRNLKTKGNTALLPYLRQIANDGAAIEALTSTGTVRSEWIFPWIGTTATSSSANWLDSLLADLGGIFDRALEKPYTQPSTGPLAGQVPEVPKLDLVDASDHYVLRMVYDRPCCGEVIVSQPSRPFKLAEFFDPDAPARPVRIPLPIDTSPEGLKKFDKGVAFMLSKELRAQMQRVTGLNDLAKGSVGPPGSLDLGLICSLSIPIITICALILLMIIVSLLDIIFHWLPFFKICLPIRR